MMGGVSTTTSEAPFSSILSSVLYFDMRFGSVLVSDDGGMDDENDDDGVGIDNDDSDDDDEDEDEDENEGNEDLAEDKDNEDVFNDEINDEYTAGWCTFEPPST